MNFASYPFEKLSSLLKGVTPNKAFEPIDFTVGEPKFQTPMFIQEALKTSTNLLNKYPKSRGSDDLLKAQIGFVKRRFNIDLEMSQLVTTLGTREALFNLPQVLLFDIQNPSMAFTNPFYQIYEGAAIASRAKVGYIDLLSKNDFLPDLSSVDLSATDLVIINFPNNPTGATLSLDKLCYFVELALKYNFILINDECYSEIYSNKRPASILNACKIVGNKDFKNVLSVNSISKRSAAPSLRSGFVAGDAQILQKYMVYRTYLGAALPEPLQVAAAKAWSDDTHSEEIRLKFKQNMDIARTFFKNVPETTFYLWLDTKQDDKLVAQNLLRDYNVKVLPGSFLSRNSFSNGFIRLALVDETSLVKEGLERIRDYLGK